MIPPLGDRPEVEVMPVDELRPGMTGYGLTVFEGSDVERFDITVKGVMKNAFADGDMIIIEASHPMLEGHGVVAGMSGSPVYIEDRLVGAVAYGWGFSIRAICGVTPIEGMLDVYQLVTDDSQVIPREYPTSLAGWPAAKQAFGHLPGWEAPTIDVPLAELGRMGIRVPDVAGPTVRFEPLAAPLLVGTRSQAVMDVVSRTFNTGTLQPVMAGLQGSSGAMVTDTTEGPALENGSAFSVVLADGDLHLAALGTATYVQGDRMVGFGHPMFGGGAIDAPIAVSEVITFLPSLMRPFKLGNAVAVKGSLRQDRLPAVGASLTARTDLVPMQVAIRAPETHTNRTFNFRLWENRDWLPQLALICMMESMDRAVRMSGPMALDLETRVTLADGRELRRQDHLSGLDLVAMFTAFELNQELSLLMNNRFEAAPVERIEVEVNVAPVPEMMVLEETRRGARVLSPGDVYTAEVEFTRWRREPVPMTLRVPLPADLRPGSYEVRVLDGPSRLRLEQQLRPDLQDPESFEEFLAAREPFYPSDAVYVVLFDPSAQPALGGMTMRSLPKSVAMTVSETARSSDALGAVPGRIVSEQVHRLDAMVGGATTFSLLVEKP